MGIQSTRQLTREDAIARLTKINDMLIMGNYKGIVESSEEYNEGDLQNMIPVNLDNVEGWTNKMLENQLEKKFWRFSMFDNYWIVDSLDQIIGVIYYENT